MPLFDMKCTNCKHKWEALVVKTTDGHQLVCPICTTPGTKEVPTNVDYKIKGFAARNSYGLKKFDDGR